MEFICKKTNQFTDKELMQLSILFKTVFHKDRSVDVLLNQYIHNVLGYSYHSIIVEDGRIVALNTYVPAYYLYRGKKLLFANSIDSMVEKSYRDFFNFQDMVNNAYEYMRQEGVSFVYGYPNDNSYPILSKSGLMKDIGRMRIYCLPYRIGGIKHFLTIGNLFSILFCRLYVLLSGLLSSSKVQKFSIYKEEISYNETRYKRADSQYNIVNRGDFSCVYKIKEHEGIRTAFLIDVFPKSSKFFNKSIWYIIKYHSKDFDLLLYPGFLSLKNTGLIQLPRKIEPKNFQFMGFVLDTQQVDDMIWCIDQWDTNLSNYDLV